MVKRIRPVSDLLVHQFEDEAVILNLLNETYYSLNGSAIRMWEILTSANSIQTGHRQLLEEYDVDGASLQADIDQFVQNLLDAKLIEVIE